MSLALWANVKYVQFGYPAELWARVRGMRWNIACPTKYTGGDGNPELSILLSGILCCITFSILSLDSTNACRYYERVIKTFRCKETEKIFSGRYSKRFPKVIQHVALRKLTLLNGAASLGFLRVPRLTGLRSCQAAGKVNGVSASTISGESALAGRTEMRMMWR